MVKALLTALIIVFVINSLVVMGLVGYGLTTGRFDSQSCQQYLATWRGEELVEPPEEEVVEEGKETPQEAGERIAKVELENIKLTRELQVQFQLLKDMKLTLEAAQDRFDKERKEFLVEKQAFVDEVERQDEVTRKANFKKALAIFSEMKPKSVKNDFMDMTDDEVVRYISEMKVDTAKTILEQFKTQEEQEKRLRIMRLLEQHNRIAANKQGTASLPGK